MNGTAFSVERVYAETCSNIRATDDISFKLMGIVPTLSGAAFLTLFLKDGITPDKARLVVPLSLFAALITLGLFRWELRNIQTCSWLRRRAEALESLVKIAVPEQPKPPRRIGKSEAEKWIYCLTIIAWLSIPPLVSTLALDGWLLWTYVTSAVLIVISTALSALESVRVMPEVQPSVDEPSE